MKDEIAVSNKETAFQIANLLVDEEYVVMISREESLYVVNYIYSQFSDRNDVVFVDRDSFYEKYREIVEE